MFGQSPKNVNANQTITTLIGAATTIEGNVSFEGGLRIDGKVKGNVSHAGEAHSMVVISEHATVEGELRAAHIVVNGTVNGPIFATELLELQPKARVIGDVNYLALEMHHGAIVQGTLSHSGESLVKPSLKLASNNS
jgi:cytoskeletal protein CcmA (bactofilin family)